MKKKILITGANGLLGQKLVYKLRDDKNVTVIATSVGENRLLSKENYIYETLDITDYSAVEAIIKKHRPDVIINTAAMTNVDACETDRKGCWKLNVTAVENIIKACEKEQMTDDRGLTETNGHAEPFDSAQGRLSRSTGQKADHQSSNHQISKSSNLPHFIHLSTDFIFDGEHGPYKEKDKANPLSYYGESKLESENVTMSYKGPWAILRTVLVYGVVDNMSRSNIVLWAKGALEKGQPINVVDDQFRTPTLAEDLAQGCILTAMKGATGTYNISGKDFMSILELVYHVADFWGLDRSIVNPIKSDTLNQTAKRPPKTGFVMDKAINELDYHPHSFYEGLEIVRTQLGRMTDDR